MSAHPAGESFAANWTARVLDGPPLVAPARHFVLPQAVPGEEEALARGALWLEVKPNGAAPFLAQCALGFAGSGVLHGVFPSPDPDMLLAVAGGYAYHIDAASPERSSLLPLRPAVAAVAAPAAAALVLVGFHALYVLQPGEAWQSPRISWEGVTITGVSGEIIHGTGWHLPTDRELPFSLDLRTRTLTGGAFPS